MTKKRIFLTICTAVTAALIFAQIDEFGATWDEFLYFKGVRGVINHGLEILGGNRPDSNAIFGDLALFGHVSRFVPFLLSQVSAVQISNLESLTDAQKFLLGSFVGLNHLSSAFFGWMTACLLGIVSWKSNKKYLGGLTFLLVIVFPDWTGSSFFNNSDIPQAFIFTCFSVTWAIQGWLICSSDERDRKRTLICSVLAGLWAGLSTSTRPGSVVFICVFYGVLVTLSCLTSRRYSRRFLLMPVGVSSISALIVFYITYPQGWNRWPWQSIYEAVTYISDRQKRGIFEAGTYIAKQLYETIPLLYLAGLSLLALALVRSLILNRGGLYKLAISFLRYEYNWVYMAMVLQFAIPLILVSASGTLLYNRLRHVMLIYPALIMLSALGLQMALAGPRSWRKDLARGGIFTVACFTFIEVALLSPYQYMYKSDVARVIDIGLGNVEISGDRYYGLNDDYFGTSQKRLFSYCIADKSCQFELLNNPDGVRQTSGKKVDGGAFNKELFEASRLLFLRPERVREVRIDDGQTKRYYLLKTNKFRYMSNNKCAPIASLTRRILIPAKKVTIGQVQVCN